MGHIRKIESFESTKKFISNNKFSKRKTKSIIPIVMPYLTEVKTIQYGPIYIKYLKNKFAKDEFEYYKSSKETDVDELD